MTKVKVEVLKLLVNICHSISPYSSWGPGSASCPDDRHSSNGNSRECSDTPLHTHPPHTHPHLTSDRARWRHKREGEMKVMSAVYRESESSRSYQSPISGGIRQNMWKTSVPQAWKNIMSFLSTYQGMQITLESSGLWRRLDGYLPAPYTTLHGHEKVGYNKCWFSEEGHWGYKKSVFHCRAEQGTPVINDFGLSLWILILIMMLWLFILLCYLIKYQDSICLALDILPFLVCWAVSKCLLLWI